MNKIVAFIGLGVVAAILAVSFVYLSWSYHDQGVVYESTIEAQVKANSVKYSQFTQTAVEQMGIAREQRDAVSKIIKDGIEGRFGPNGSSAMVQAFKEAYPANFDGALYGKIMTTIEVGRTEFAFEQKQLISKVQIYENALNKKWSGMWLKNEGYPKIDLKDPRYNPIVTASTKKAFETGVDEGVKF